MAGCSGVLTLISVIVPGNNLEALGTGYEVGVEKRIYIFAIM